VRIALTAAISVAILWVVMAELWTVSWPPPVGWRDPALNVAPVRAVDALLRHDSDDSLLLAKLDADMRHQRL
jgi:hypothetical protein